MEYGERSGCAFSIAKVAENNNIIKPAKKIMVIISSKLKFQDMLNALRTRYGEKIQTLFNNPAQINTKTAHQKIVTYQGLRRALKSLLASTQATPFFHCW
jgi:hypothetical protein